MDITKRKILCFGHWKSGHWTSGHWTIRPLDFPTTQIPQNNTQQHRDERRRSDLGRASYRFAVALSLSLLTATTAGIPSLHHLGRRLCGANPSGCGRHCTAYCLLFQSLMPAHLMRCDICITHLTSHRRPHSGSHCISDR